MSKAIEAMKEEGWEETDLYCAMFDSLDEYKIFKRPKQRPNAIVNFPVLMAELSSPILNLPKIWRKRILACIRDTNGDSPL